MTTETSTAHAHFDYAIRTYVRSTRPGVHVVAAALDLVAPLKGHTFRALCCWCVEREIMASAEGVPCRRLGWGGECERCPVVGGDVILALVKGISIALDLPSIMETRGTRDAAHAA